jgi:hypothetical protein
MRDLFIYHPGTGTVIGLDDVVFLCDSQYIEDDILDCMTNGGTVREYHHKGYRLDNYNMTNLFYGE